jgi:hypothetical protein
MWVSKAYEVILKGTPRKNVAPLIKLAAQAFVRHVELEKRGRA